MSDGAIELTDVGVCYRLYRERVFSLKETAIRSAKRAVSLLRGARPEPTFKALWAIRNLSFSVARGSSVGIVGRNGSGKSTALKVICGVLHPSEGRLWVRGRVAALIELGAGFDPELTGRENIYLGAAVSGLSRKEIERKIDRIVDFSELGEFIDLPVKNYSSGMYARLGFSLATDIDPDLLIIDEILGVGDQQFQAKCLDRMNDFRRRNKTILLVSHDVAFTQSFCSRLIHLEHGRMIEA